MTYYPDLYTEAITADIIEASADATFLGWIDRFHYDRTQDAKGQDIWRIRKVLTSESNGKTTTEILYPSGNDSHSFCWNDKDTYNYKFKN